jgi:trk system potassium uptake protein TrkA
VHIVIAGAGEIGGQIARTLQGQHEIVLIDRHPEARDRWAQLDVQFVVGHGTDPEVLREARVDRADVFIAATNWDEVNLIACMLAKGLGAKEALCFVGKQSYVDVLTDPRTIEILGTRIDRVLWPQKALAQEIVQIIQVPGAIDTELLLGGRLRFVEYRILAQGTYAGKVAGGLSWPEGVFLAGILRQEEFITATQPAFAQLVLQPEDRLFFFATPQGFDALQACFAPKGRVRRVMVVGGGNVGYMVAQELLRQRLEIVIIEHDPERCAWLAEQLPGAWVLEGDGTNLELLQNEGLERTDVLVAVTENDEKNLLVSLLAKQVGVAKVITRVNRSENRRLFEYVGIDIPLTPRQAAVQDVVDWLSSQRADRKALLDEQLELVEVTLPESFDPTPLARLELPETSIVVSVERGKRILLPQEGLEVLPNDRLLILASREVVHEVLARFV